MSPTIIRYLENWATIASSICKIGSIRNIRKSGDFLVSAIRRVVLFNHLTHTQTEHILQAKANFPKRPCQPRHLLFTLSSHLSQIKRQGTFLFCFYHNCHNCHIRLISRTGEISALTVRHNCHHWYKCHFHPFSHTGARHSFARRGVCPQSTDAINRVSTLFSALALITQISDAGPEGFSPRKGMEGR